MSSHRTLRYCASLLAAILCGIATAQNYSFSVPEVRMRVQILEDASARIVYDITFANNGGAHPVDVVDVGLPHGRYDIGNMSANVGGQPTGIIRPSEYVKPGVEVHLDGYSIQPGTQGTFHFECTMPDMVYQDTTQRDYASLRITPTWFGSQYVTGTTDLQLAVLMLPGVAPEEVKWQGEPHPQVANFRGQAVAYWRWSATTFTGPHMVGVSFPKRGMSRVVRMTKFGLLVKWLKDSPGVRWFLGACYIALFAFLFFRFSGGTGCSVFVLGAALLVGACAASPAFQILGLLPMAGLIYWNEKALKKRAGHYLPPIAQVEGGGIKRGLTAPEAAVLLEAPLHKVLTLVIFGMLKKGLVRVLKHDPLTVEVVPSLRAYDAKAGLFQPKFRTVRQRAARENGKALRAYEHPFLNAIEQHPNVPVKDIDFGEAMTELIQYVAKRVKDFDLSDTQDYYRYIVGKAMREAKAEVDIPKREKRIDRDLDWILLDDDYPTVLTYGDYTYRPYWGRSYSGGWGGGAAAPAAPASGGRTTFGDVASSFAGWTENTMGSMTNAIAPGSLNLSTPSGIIDLSGVDRVTGDVFDAMMEGSSSGGGGGGGCACAGCACACACAGGGR